MSGVTYYQLGQSTTSVPTVDGASGSYIDGFYGVNGTLEYLIMRLQVTTTGSAPAWETDLSALVTQFKLVINGTWPLRVLRELYRRQVSPDCNGSSRNQR